MNFSGAMDAGKFNCRTITCQFHLNHCVWYTNPLTARGQILVNGAISTKFYWKKIVKTIYSDRRADERRFERKSRTFVQWVPFWLERNSAICLPKLNVKQAVFRNFSPYFDTLDHSSHKREDPALSALWFIAHIKKCFTVYDNKASWVWHIVHFSGNKLQTRSPLGKVHKR